LLAQADVPAYRAVLAEGWSPGTSLLQAERARLDFDHALVCGWLCDAWSFPEPLSRAITHHHDEQAPLSVRVAAELERGEADLDRVVAAAESLLTMPADRTLALWSESSDPERTAA
jgi:HD-like signal output (HDOD) protein